MNKGGRRSAAVLYAAVSGLCLALVGCSAEPKQGGSPAPAAPPAAAAPAAAETSSAQPKRYDLKGKVMGVDKAGKKISVDGEDIPGFMSAMTMAYPVKDEHLLDDLKAGDRITAKIVSTGTNYWLEDIATVK